MKKLGVITWKQAKEMLGLKGEYTNFDGNAIKDSSNIELYETTLDKCLNWVGDSYYHDGSMGVSEEYRIYTLICDDGDVIQVPYSYHWSSNYAHSQTRDEDAEGTLKDVLPLQGKVIAIFEDWKEINDWPGQEYINEGGYKLYLLRPIPEEKIRKIRRRCEDVLRKSNPQTVLGVAHFLGVRLD